MNQAKARAAEAQWRREQEATRTVEREVSESEYSHLRYAGAGIMDRIFGRECRKPVRFITPAMMKSNPHLRRK